MLVWNALKSWRVRPEGGRLEIQLETRSNPPVMSHLVRICGLKTQETLEAALEARRRRRRLRVLSTLAAQGGVEPARGLASACRGRARRSRCRSMPPTMSSPRGRGAQARHAATARQGNAGACGRGARALRPAVMKAVPVEARADRRRSRSTPRSPTACCSTLRAREATRPGGLGERSTGRLLENAQSERAVHASGGSCRHVAEALRITRAPAVDVSSGVERAPGDKDPEKIAPSSARRARPRRRSRQAVSTS